MQSFLSDLEWFKRGCNIFQELQKGDLSGFANLVKEQNSIVKKSVLKHAMTESATKLAIAMAFTNSNEDVVVVAAPIEQYLCTLCDYVAVTKQDLNMHTVATSARIICCSEDHMLPIVK